MSHPVVLRLAADLIEQRGWAQHHASPDEGPLCAAIAISAARNKLYAPRYDAHCAFMDYLGLKHNGSIGHLFQWNDAPERKKFEVVGRLRAAAAQLEQTT